MSSEARANAPAIWRPHMPELDALRGLAVVSVFSYHAFFWSGVTGGSILALILSSMTRLGFLGVDLFFVLSGFLITGRLLERQLTRPDDYYKWFYIRRALRILPLYYTMLALVGGTLLYSGETTPTFLAAAALYVPNIALLLGVAATAPLAVLWSLGIEEQVYLVWPTIVRSVTPRTLAIVFGVLGVLQPILRFAAVRYRLILGNVSMATWLRLDGFAWGGALAVLVVCGWIDRRRLVMLGTGAAGIAGSIGLLCVMTGQWSRTTPWGAALQFGCADLLFAGVLALALAYGSGVARMPRPLATLTFFGDISYCVYLVHLFVFWGYDRLAPAPPGHDPATIIVRAFVVLLVSVAVATASRRHFELPILSLKSRFGDDRPERAYGTSPISPLR